MASKVVPPASKSASPYVLRGLLGEQFAPKASRASVTSGRNFSGCSQVRYKSRLKMRPADFIPSWAGGLRCDTRRPRPWYVAVLAEFGRHVSDADTQRYERGGHRAGRRDPEDGEFVVRRSALQVGDLAIARVASAIADPLPVHHLLYRERPRSSCSASNTVGAMSLGTVSSWPSP